MAVGGPDCDMTLDLPDDARLAQALHEVLRVRRVQIQRPAGLQRAVDGAEDLHELVVVDVLGEVQRERGVEVAGVPGAEGGEVGAVKRPVPDAERVSPALRGAHERLGEVDADILANAGADQLQQDAVAAAEVGDDIAAVQLEERHHSPHPLDRVGIVLLD